VFFFLKIDMSHVVVDDMSSAGLQSRFQSLLWCQEKHNKRYFCVENHIFNLFLPKNIFTIP
jgi:hypothetical protein